jgi:hypothetical protein
MQRRLKKLIAGGRLQITGAGKSTRYLAPGQPRPKDQAPHEIPARKLVEGEGGISILLSVAGAEIQRQVRRPAIERPPVGYQREFLSGYLPNVTSYLSQRERDRLASVGAVDVDTKPAGTYAREILDRLLIDLSWNSSRLEGNTYSILDTHLLIEQGKSAEGKSAEETAMIMNHKNAIEFLVEAADEIGFNRHTLLNLHSLLADGLLDAVSTGRLRQRIVGIRRSAYTPLATPQIIEECFTELLAKAEAITNPFEQALFVSIQLPYLQPFADVNKRVSRLAANIPFIRRNLTPISFIDVPDELYIEAMLGVYELNKIDLARDMFIWAYERSARRYAAVQQSVGAPDQFRLRYREQLRNIVSEVIRERRTKSAASELIEQFALANITPNDRRLFREAAQAELIGLHEGNFARYKVKPSEFYAWKAVWEG